MIDIRPSLSIPGWMSEQELTWLAKRASHAKHILEIGVWKGRATRTLINHTRGTVMSVDPWLPYDVQDGELSAMDGDAIYAEVQARFADVRGRLQLVRGTSDNLPGLPAQFDFIFIDGDHAEASVKHDIEMVLGRLAPGGILAGHDIWIADVVRAVRGFFPSVDRPAGVIWSTVPDAQQIAFGQSLRDERYSVACLLEAFSLLGLPTSLVDVGCGNGHVVRAAQARGVQARGLDLYAPEPCDLTLPWYGDPAEWALCWEVAEHLPASAAETLCDTLARATTRKLLFSAAVPGQGGSGHYNEQPHEYWRTRLEARGLRYNARSSKELSDAFMRVASPAWWYGQNIQVFER